MRVGFTGTQKGMSPAQIQWVGEFLSKHRPVEFHLGDCIGADTDCYYIIENFNSGNVYPGIVTFGHIPIYDYKRSKLKYTFERAPKPYLDRNHDIVDESDVILATPGETEEQLRSGTWATIRYAKKTRKQLHIIYPDGAVQSFNV